MNQSEQSQLEHSLDLLGARQSHSWQDVEKQYRQLVQQWHPDRNTDGAGETAKSKFIEINTAYKHLRNHYQQTDSILRDNAASNPHHIQPEQTGPLLGTKKQTLIKPGLYKNKFVIAGLASVMIAVLFGALLWSLDSQLAKNNRDRASFEDIEPETGKDITPFESELVGDDVSKQSSADAAF